MAFLLTLNFKIMKTDTYTKIILTIIAIVLTANFLKGSTTPAKADDKHYALVPVNSDGSINVNFKKENTIDVNIAAVDPFVFQFVQPLSVRVKQ